MSIIVESKSELSRNMRNHKRMREGMWGNNFVVNKKKSVYIAMSPNINYLHFYWIDFMEWKECASSFETANLSSKLGVFLFMCVRLNIFFYFVCMLKFHYYIFASFFLLLLLTFMQFISGKKRAKSSSSFSLALREQSFILLKLKCMYRMLRKFVTNIYKEKRSIDGIF